jgi:hypothetical protein
MEGAGASQGHSMSYDNMLGLILSLLVAAYLVVALLLPEKL